MAAGTRDQTLEIARRAGSSGAGLAMDLSAAMIAATRAHADAAGLPNVRTAVADAQALGLDGAGGSPRSARLE